MKSGGFFKKFGVCALSAALCVSAFSACGATDGKGDKIEMLNPKSKKTLFGRVIDKDTVEAEIQ